MNQVYGLIPTLILSTLLILAVILTLFLYFRSGRRELLERETLFDFAFWATIGGLFGGRLFDFLTRADFYNWSSKKLFFFNVWWGFDVWGALAGCLLAGALFLKRGNESKFWIIFDLSAPPLSFGAFLVSLGLFSQDLQLVYLALGTGYFIIFWAIKRLERIKRPPGFFICFFGVSVALLNLVLYPLKGGSRVFWGHASYNLVLPSFFLIIFAILWLMVSKRKIKEDLKGILALLLLVLFKLRRILTSVTEADNLARSIVMLPLSISKSIYYLVSLVGREIYQSLLDFASALGVRK